MPKCFVIQPFDNEKFDKRYKDVFEPAIRDAKFEPYRVDKDPSVVVPINEIESNIANSDVCLVEISTDNPNVWFELGYAIASDRKVVLICSDERERKYPFDVQHRSIIEYETQSQSDFEKARSEITSRLEAALSADNTSSDSAPRYVDSSLTAEGTPSKSTPKYVGSIILSVDESIAIVTFAQSIHDLEEDGTTIFELVERLKKAGTSKLNASSAVQSLLEKGFLERYKFTNSYDESCTQVRLTSEGMSWILDRVNDKVCGDDIPF